jgi:predicted transcriptional regulator
MLWRGFSEDFSESLFPNSLIVVIMFYNLSLENLNNTYIHICTPLEETSSLQRGRWDIMASVLRVARSPKSRTHIMYGANLSFRQLERYMGLLLDKGLLRVSEEINSKAKQLYVITDLGMSFLDTYRRLAVVDRGKPRS